MISSADLSSSFLDIVAGHGRAIQRIFEEINLKDKRHRSGSFGLRAGWLTDVGRRWLLLSMRWSSTLDKRGCLNRLSLGKWARYLQYCKVRGLRSLKTTFPSKTHTEIDVGSYFYWLAYRLGMWIVTPRSRCSPGHRYTNHLSVDPYSGSLTQMVYTKVLTRMSLVLNPSLVLFLIYQLLLTMALVLYKTRT